MTKINFKSASYLNIQIRLDLSGFKTLTGLKTN